MPAPSSLGPTTPTATTSEHETLGVVWIGEPHGIEQKLPLIAPDVRVSVRDENSAIEALASADADVVVIDTTIAGTDAQAILLRMKTAGIDLPIVLVATGGSARLATDANQLAVCDVVVKIPGFEQQLPAAFAQVRARHDLVRLFRESRQGQDRLRAILEFQPAVVGVIGPDGILAAMNQAGLSLVGAAQDQVVGRSFTTLLPPENHDELLELVRRACAGEAGALDHSMLKADATRVDVRTQAVPFQNNQGGVALVTIEKRSGATAGEVASLAARCEALTAALGEANAQLDGVRLERISESAGAHALSSELADAVAALNQERDRSRHLLAEIGASNTEALAALTGRCETLTASLSEATAQLEEARAQGVRGSARAEALASELTQSEATLNIERERSRQFAAEAATANAAELASLKEQCDATASDLREAHAQLQEVRAESARISSRADAISAELAESVSALAVEREKSGRLLGELGIAKTMIEQSSWLQALREADLESMKALREHLRGFSAEAERLCSNMIDRPQIALDQADRVPA